MEDAEDLMLDAFAEIASRDRWSSAGSSFRTWLFAIGRKKALMLLRKQRHRTGPFPEEEPAGSGAPDTDLLREERDRHLYEAMKMLKPEYREALVLIYFEEMSHEEAAGIMGKTMKQTYHLVSRGRERLREILRKMGFEYAQYE